MKFFGVVVLLAAGTGVTACLNPARTEAWCADAGQPRPRFLSADPVGLESGGAHRRAALRQVELLRAIGMRLDSDVQLTDRLDYVPVDTVTLEQARAKAVQERSDYKAQRDRSALDDVGSLPPGILRERRQRAFGIVEWKPTRKCIEVAQVAAPSPAESSGSSLPNGAGIVPDHTSKGATAAGQFLTTFFNCYSMGAFE